MAPADRLKTLKLLQRVSHDRLERIGNILAAIRSKQSQLAAQSEALTALALQEALSSTLDTRPHLPAFLGSVDSQQRNWAKESDTLEQEAHTIEHQLFDAFRDLKTKEMVRSKVESSFKSDEENSEMTRLDDTIRALHHSNKHRRSIG